MPKPTSSYRIPKYLKDFIAEFKKEKKIESSTDVVIYALDTLKKIWETQKKENYNLEFVKPSIDDEWMTPKAKVLNKVETDPNFRKEEYKVVLKISPEQVQDYIDNYQELGMTLQDYYKTHVEK